MVHRTMGDDGFACDDRPSRASDVPLADGDDVSLDAVFSLLADRRRRLVLRYFLDAPTTVASIDDLVDVLHEVDGDPAADLRLHLYHLHLPRLEAAGVVDFDPGRGVVRYLGSPRLERFLRAAGDERPD